MQLQRKQDKKSRICWNSQSPKRSCNKQSRNERTGLVQGLTAYRIFGGESLKVRGVKH